MDFVKRINNDDLLLLTVTIKIAKKRKRRWMVVKQAWVRKAKMKFEHIYSSGL